MRRLYLNLASGYGSPPGDTYPKVLRFIRYGCANRAFYHLTLMNQKSQQKVRAVEQLGSYDTVHNNHSEKLVALNLERIQYWFTRDMKVTRPCLEVLGLAGFLPVHPRTYMRAWRQRRLTKYME
ncbi:unnamed protein product [Trichogramma brassicae]|uniref:Small ribosomal subunit protein bS16m n=1 Tax=Trichogramma brassicae TaxID=86971 RepID=A0A6H5IAE2_9HYME|nr:unnamed protein product [Trichogramma brassicae]